MAEIQVSDILYYDPIFKPECYNFCKERNIDCLPALEDSKKIFIRQAESPDFIEETVTDERMVDSSLNIFDPGLANKFSTSPLLLVFSNNGLTGVVHFSDYNQPNVSIYLYRIFLAYEKALRTILEIKQLHSKDMVEYFQYRAAHPKEPNDKNRFSQKAKEYEKRKEDFEKLPEFQMFYLKDLIEFTEYKEIIFVENNVAKLRNMVMHAHDFVNLENPHTDDLIYNPKTFREFFDLAVIFHKDYKRVANHLAFINKPKTSQEPHA